MSKVLSGLDCLRADGFASLRGQRVGLLANQAAVSSDFRHIADVLAEAPGVDLVLLFAPEHGFRGELQDMEHVAQQQDANTKLPIRSLYGTDESTLTPALEDLKSIDTLVIDLPDIGTRYYTFAQSMAYSMKTAGVAGTRVVVLDRPNPINGVSIEGAPLLATCRSFCGYAPIANRHGLTIGEIAKLVRSGFGEGSNSIPSTPCELEVIRVKNWNRRNYFDQTGLPWVLPSPNMPRLDTALIYPGSCLFEATSISEGRGTTLPLEQFGAPYIDGLTWAAETQQMGLSLSGAVLRPTSFIPRFQKHAGTICHGLQLHISDRQTFRPLRWTLAMIAALKKLYPAQFSWREEAFEFIDPNRIPTIDLLYGSPSYRNCIAQGKPLNLIEQELKAFEAWYTAARKPHLIY